MNDNETRFVEDIVNYESNIKNILAYIKENYQIDGEFNEENCTVKLICPNVDNALMLAQAKEYIEETMGDGMVAVVF